MSDNRGRSRSRRGSIEEEEYESRGHNRGRDDRRGSYDRRGGGDSDRRNRDGSYDRRNRDGSNDRRNRDGSYDRRNRDGSYDRRNRDGSNDRRNRDGSYDRRNRDGSNDRRRDRSGSRDRRGENDRDRRGGENVVRMDSLADPEKRYTLKGIIGSGVCGNVYEAIDEDAGGRKVAIKIQKLSPDTERFIMEEYRVLRELSSHPNLPEFYGIYRKRTIKKNEQDEIWFVMQLCEGGSVANMVRGMLASDKKMKEEHIAYILRETIKAVLHLHENQVMHRDIQASNIVLTKEGDVKLVDFGLSRAIRSEMGKRKTCIGSPCYMAPELVMSKGADSNGYDPRTDVWAIGITAIELADGKPPFQDMHPTRALFQIVRNPPPTLYRQSKWTQTFNDFIAECLEKNPEHRPVMPEILEHPFISELPENDYHLTQELKSLNDTMQLKGRRQKVNEMIVHKNLLKSHQSEPPEIMHTEDLAALDHITEDIILDQLHHRLQLGQFHTFVGDVLLVLNPNEDQDIYGPEYHCKYQCKSRSDNAPHIYSVADSAYQDVLHNEEPQNILLAGESNSGKTTNMLHLVNHLMFLGKSLKDIGGRVMKSIKILQAFTNSATPLNPNSTRCMLQIQTTYGNTGKASGAIFWLYQLEKWRVSSRDKNQSNFHILYYFYDGMEHAGKLKMYGMHPGRKQRFLRIGDKSSSKRSFKVRNDPYGNSAKFEELKEQLRAVDMEEHFVMMWNVLAAIINLGDIRFVEGQDNDAQIHNIELANKIADLLGVEQKKFTWSLTNYCLIKKGAAVRRRHTCDEAKECRDVLANTIYQRLVDWIVNTINLKLTVTRTLFGDKFCINILDLFGFECFSVNRFDQLVINTMNEQLQCYYNQRVFAWEMQEQNEEDIPRQMFHFYDNKDAIEQLMGRNGLFQIIDESSRQMEDAHYILSRLQERQSKNIHIKAVSAHEFSVAHYTGKLVYDASEIPEKNRDYLSLELVETLRQSTFEPIQQMFSNKLSRSGNLTVHVTDTQKQEKKTPRSKWGAALMQETTKLRRCNSASRGQFSQSKKVRTCAATYRSTSLEILKSLSVGAGSGGTHFVRCIRSDLEGSARGFYRDVVRQQIRALAVLDTTKARQKGYPHRIPFQEFLRRYKFLAFDFDENVELTKDNCRLLLIRLKMEGWVIGKSKVFLKYYNEEYLSRLYETQVKKIIKVQCMLRAFLAKKNMASKNTRYAKPRKEVESVVKASRVESPQYVRRRRSPSIAESLSRSHSPEGIRSESEQGDESGDEGVHRVLRTEVEVQKHIPSPPTIPSSPVPRSGSILSAGPSIQSIDSEIDIRDE